MLTLATALGAIGGAAGCGLLFHRDLPLVLAGLPRTFTSRDRPGLRELEQFRVHGLAMRGGAFGFYGGGAASLWVTNAADTAAAAALVQRMSQQIAAGDMPFTPDSTAGSGGRELHRADGVGQRHVYFRSGRRVVWLAARRELADAALADALRFYP